nr:MAG TPA: hypothetical protein [Caudoviricetes sp.]
MLLEHHQLLFADPCSMQEIYLWPAYNLLQIHLFPLLM